MKQNSIRRFASLTGLVFALVTASSSALAAETHDEIFGQYNQAIECDMYMGIFTILAKRIGDKKLEAAYEAATERYMRESVRLGAKLKKSENEVIDEIKKTGEFYAKLQTRYSEREIKTFTTFCAPEILPLLK